ncbi:hypothetical protein [Marinobacter goseongensis]|uniref:hypothetical protein n=1 Tax=Marinobacter goseongensis TaxID=453838 RepID=UPI002003C5AF|nr:hypothetical protein [Marinobacter goseongensis]MCK7553344.1 hypothetical protein [Marinobacter goseongensis]
MRRKVGDAFIVEATGLTPAVFHQAMASLQEGAKRTRSGNALDFMDNTVRETVQALVIASAAAGDVSIDGEPLIDRMIKRVITTFDESSELWRHNMLPMTDVVGACVNVACADLLLLQGLEIRIRNLGEESLWVFPRDRWLIKHAGRTSVEPRHDRFGVVPIEAGDLVPLLMTSGIQRAMGLPYKASGGRM